MTYHGSPSEHASLLTLGRDVMAELAKDSRVLDVAAPMLSHPDLHMRNIFVDEHDPTLITAFIDWQSASTEPAFWYSEIVPDFASRKPDAQGQITDENELDYKAYRGCLRYLIPKISQAISLDETFFRLFRYCFRTWMDGAVVFRQELIDTCQEWERLGLPGSCPFPMPGPEALAVHRKHQKKFEAHQELINTLSTLLKVDADGRMAPQAWEPTLLEHKKLYSSILETILENKDHSEDEPIKNEVDLRELWPFDLKLLG